MFERFTPRARHVVVLAQEEARALRHDYIGTEHLLLGLLREEEGLAARALESLGVSVEEARRWVQRIVGRGRRERAPAGMVPFTPRAKRVLELAANEADALGHNYIGTEHVLLGLAREGESVAVDVLSQLGAGVEAVRAELLRMLGGPTRPRPTLPRRPERRRDRAPLGRGGALIAASLGVGILIGWLIWGN